ncbi:hypothetical protein [Flavivirga spongiicola]|uniref:Uncharacterized protein n=1 Tax=Flavivirga spongiicola TaxID=421621 RepID=A0ABU7XVE0_9FLAO|nr:hypothetical protein [Flavivirga sp. MEBiC05379]MDO5979746.1 hypothetical protein [Flavivirga sp. MEBiC05379]
MKKIIENNKLLKADRNIFYISVITSSFLMMIYINHTYTKLSFVLLGVIQEMFTIPCVLIQPVLLYLALRNFFKVKFKLKPYISFTVVISLTTMVFTWGDWLLTRF